MSDFLSRWVFWTVRLWIIRMKWKLIVNPEEEYLIWREIWFIIELSGFWLLFVLFYCREREQSWSENGPSTGPAGGPVKEVYDGPAGMDPDGVIESSWNQVGDLYACFYYRILFCLEKVRLGIMWSACLCVSLCREREAWSIAHWSDLELWTWTWSSSSCLWQIW